MPSLMHSAAAFTRSVFYGFLRFTHLRQASRQDLDASVTVNLLDNGSPASDYASAPSSIMEEEIKEKPTNDDETIKSNDNNDNDDNNDANELIETANADDTLEAMRKRVEEFFHDVLLKHRQQEVIQAVFRRLSASFRPDEEQVQQNFSLLPFNDIKPEALNAIIDYIHDNMVMIEAERGFHFWYTGMFFGIDPLAETLASPNMEIVASTGLRSGTTSNRSSVYSQLSYHYPNAINTVTPETAARMAGIFDKTSILDKFDAIIVMKKRIAEWNEKCGLHSRERVTKEQLAEWMSWDETLMPRVQFDKILKEAVQEVSRFWKALDIISE